MNLMLLILYRFTTLLTNFKILFLVALLLSTIQLFCESQYDFNNYSEYIEQLNENSINSYIDSLNANSKTSISFSSKFDGNLENSLFLKYRDDHLFTNFRYDNLCTPTGGVSYANNRLTLGFGNFTYHFGTGNLFRSTSNSTTFTPSLLQSSLKRFTGIYSQYRYNNLHVSSFYSNKKFFYKRVDDTNQLSYRSANESKMKQSGIEVGFQYKRLKFGYLFSLFDSDIVLEDFANKKRVLGSSFSSIWDNDFITVKGELNYFFKSRSYSLVASKSSLDSKSELSWRRLPVKSIHWTNLSLYNKFRYDSETLQLKHRTKLSDNYMLEIKSSLAKNYTTKLWRSNIYSKVLYSNIGSLKFVIDRYSTEENDIYSTITTRGKLRLIEFTPHNRIEVSYQNRYYTKHHENSQKFDLAFNFKNRWGKYKIVNSIYENYELEEIVYSDFNTQENINRVDDDFRIKFTYTSNRHFKLKAQLYLEHSVYSPDEDALKVTLSYLL